MLTDKSTSEDAKAGHFAFLMFFYTFFFYKQPFYKQPGLRFFENNNRIQWSIVMLNNGEQNKF